MLPSTVVHHPAIAKASLPAPSAFSASPSCVSGVGLSFVDEMPSLGSLSLSSYAPLPQQSYSFGQFIGGANRNLATTDGMDGRKCREGSEGGNTGGDGANMGQGQDEINGMPPLWEEAEEGTELGEDSKVCLCQQCHFQTQPHGWYQEEHCLTMSTPLSPLKTELPLSVAFVGLEPGTEQFVDNPFQLHHPTHPHLHDHFLSNDQHPNPQLPPFPHHLADYQWTHSFPQMEVNSSNNGHLLFTDDFGHISPDGTHFSQNNAIEKGNYEGYVPIGREEGEGEQFRITDISSSNCSSNASFPFDYCPPPPISFDPLSVDTSASWSGAESSGHSSTEETIEYSSLSQDEIYEQIQKECAEFEHQSSSDGVPKQKTKMKGKKTKAIAAKKGAAPVVMKKKAYSGRASASSLDLAETEALSVSTAGGGRRERKKELNRVAATRYREKKRKERELTSGELSELEQRNAQLKADIAAVQAEMDYLKGLAAEIETARKRRGRQ